ncbi:MAG: SPFH domain-containing protein [Acidobacteriota bacterium]
MDFVKKQFLDIIQWEDDSQDVLVYKFPMQDNEIQNGGKLVVRPGQTAVFVNEGKIADVFGEGTHNLTTQNLPVLGDLKGWAFGFESPFKADVYFVSSKQFIDQKWGTPAPVLVPDPKFEQVEVKAFGSFAFQVTDPRRFVTNVSSTNRTYSVKEIADQLKAFIISDFVPVIVQQKLTVAELAANYQIINKAMMEASAEEFDSLGLALVQFQIVSLTLQEEYQEMMRKRSAVNIMGGMQNYAQVKTLDVMEKSVENPGMNAMNQAGMGIGMGLGVGQVFAQNMQGSFQAPQPPPMGAPGAATAAPAATAPAAAAAAGMIICAGCQGQLPAGSKFCSSCGAKVEQAPAKKFCTECGTQVAGTDAFCNNCGTKVQ